MLLGVEVFGAELTLVGIGAMVAGLGSLLSGLAAYKLATRKESDEPKTDSDDS